MPKGASELSIDHLKNSHRLGHRLPETRKYLYSGFLRTDNQVTVPSKEDPPEAAVSALLENQAMEVPGVAVEQAASDLGFLQALA
jgi:hypothetical protein